jgi:hypothetical protein
MIKDVLSRIKDVLSWTNDVLSWTKDVLSWTKGVLSWTKDVLAWTKDVLSWTKDVISWTKDGLHGPKMSSHGLKMSSLSLACPEGFFYAGEPSFLPDGDRKQERWEIWEQGPASPLYSCYAFVPRDQVNFNIWTIIRRIDIKACRDPPRPSTTAVIFALQNGNNKN